MKRAGRPALALTLWITGLLLAGRVAILFVLGHHERGDEAEVVLWRVANDELPVTTLHALGCGALATWLAFAGAARRAGASRVLAGALAAALLLSVLSGWPVAEADQVPSLATQRGRLALGVLTLLSVGAALLLGSLAGSTQPPSRTTRALRSPLALVGGALLAFLAPLIFGLTFGNLSPTRTVRLRLVEVPFEPELWRVTHEHPAGPVALGVVTPSLDYRVDGGDLPALLMAPPAEIVLRVPESPAGLSLRASAGVDHQAHLQLVNAGQRATVGFEILVDGEEVLSQEVRVGVGREDELIWKRLGRRGLRVRPGTEVVLRTRLVGGADAQTLDLPPITAGFGELVLDHEVERPRTSASPRTPNVILIVMDTLRADRMSCYGYGLATTPHLDALAARGLLFEEAFATSSWTWPATASILTGLIPEAHQVVHDGSCYLDGKITTLAEVLGERGYTTGAFTCNPLIVPNKNFDQGFEVFDSFPSFRKTDVVLDRITKWLRMHRRDRFFLYLHLVDPHWSYEPLPESVELVGLGPPPPGFPERGIVDYHQLLVGGEGFGPDGELLVDALVPASHREHMQREYDAAVHTSDHYVGQLLETLTRLGLDEKTIIVFTSDHGEEILDHGLVTHGISLYRELTRVPLILAGPSIPVGRVGTPVSNRHIAPTIAALAGGEMPALPPVLELLEPDELPQAKHPILLFEPDTIPAEPIFFSTHQGWWKGQRHSEIYGMIDGDWEVHFAPKGRAWGAPPGETKGDLALYHLPSDPAQHRDVAADHPQRAKRMIERMLHHHQVAQEAGRNVRLGAGRASILYLQDLGYLGTETARCGAADR